MLKLITQKAISTWLGPRQDSIPVSKLNALQRLDLSSYDKLALTDLEIQGQGYNSVYASCVNGYGEAMYKATNN